MHNRVGIKLFAYVKTCWIFGIQKSAATNCVGVACRCNKVAAQLHFSTSQLFILINHLDRETRFPSPYTCKICDSPQI